MTVIYENSFDWNEWFVIIAFISFHFLFWKMPKIFTPLKATAFYLYGVSLITFFDHTISVGPWDFYDVNDSSNYEFLDFLSYVMNGPISYFFIYLYVKWEIKGLMNLVYLFVWSSFALLVEWFAVNIGLYHFSKGYRMYWSFTIYFFMQSLLIVYFHLLNRKNPRPEN